MTTLLRTGIPRKDNGKIDYRPRGHHGWTFFIMILGFLLPPLAVAARFGIGKDFFINVLCTICGYFPGHGHNFFIQNIRNNDRAARTPKWAVRYGLVDDTAAKRLQKKRQWVGRYNDRVPERTMYDDDGKPYVYRERVSGKPALDPTLLDRDQFYGAPGADSENSSVRDRYGSSSSNGRASYDQHSLSNSRSRTDPSALPGQGEVDARHSKKRGIFSRKSKSGKEAGANGYGLQGGHGEPDSGVYDDPDPMFGPDSRAGAPSTGPSSSISRVRDDSFDRDGPEDADATVGKSYRGSSNVSGRKVSTGDSVDHPLADEIGHRKSGAPQKDVLEDNFQF